MFSTIATLLTSLMTACSVPARWRQRSRRGSGGSGFEERARRAKGKDCKRKRKRRRREGRVGSFLCACASSQLFSSVSGKYIGAPCMVDMVHSCGNDRLEKVKDEDTLEKWKWSARVVAREEVSREQKKNSEDKVYFSFVRGNSCRCRCRRGSCEKNHVMRSIRLCDRTTALKLLACGW